MTTSRDQMQSGLMPSQSPKYRLAERTRAPSVPPDHPFEGPGERCVHVVLRLESGWPVWCALRRDQHESVTASPGPLPDPEEKTHGL